jgi:hypothetical protein
MPAETMPGARSPSFGVTLRSTFSKPVDRDSGETGIEIRDTKEKTMTEENEKRVRAFYEATVLGHRESLRGLQAPHVVYDLPEGFPAQLRLNHWGNI